MQKKFADCRVKTLKITLYTTKTLPYTYLLNHNFVDRQWNIEILSFQGTSKTILGLGLRCETNTLKKIHNYIYVMDVSFYEKGIQIVELVYNIVARF